MSTSLYTRIANARLDRCPARQAQGWRWLADLPPDLQDLVVPPVSVDVFEEYEMQAEGAAGRDAGDAPCYYEFRHMLTQLRSDDDESFYETPVYAEAVTSWRLVDERWLVCRSTLDRLHLSGAQTRYSVSETQPR
jgi:hypothetical protein